MTAFIQLPLFGHTMKYIDAVNDILGVLIGAHLTFAAHMGISLR